MSIQVKNIIRSYEDQKALDDVSFVVKPGEILGFIGPNGAGKSTMMKIITGFIAPSSGQVLIDGKDVMTDSINTKKIIGYLPEHNPLYLEMFVKEYLNYVAGLYKIRKNKNKLVEEMIELTGLGDEKKKKIGALSKGFRQRVGLAQALIHDPKILILDEPTTGLDPNQIIEIRNLISEVGKKKTVMLSTHIMQEVEAICDKIIIINKGKIVANEKAGDIVQNISEDQQIIVVEFNKPVKEKSLQSIKEVSNIAKVSDKKWVIQSNSKEDIRENIFNYAVDNKISVLSLQKQERSLEDVFHELTK